MGFLDRFRRPAEPQNLRNSVTFNGVTYPLGVGFGSGLAPDLSNYFSAGRPTVTGDLASVVAAAQPHSVVSAAVLARALLMSQLWFEYADAGDHSRFQHENSEILQRPGGVGMTRQRLHMAASQQSDYTGNVYTLRRPNGTLRHMRADRVSLVIESDTNPRALDEIEASEQDGSTPQERRDWLEALLDHNVVAYRYQPHPRARAQYYDPADVSHWVAEPHPLSPYIGASWITSVIRELQADIQADTAVDKFFENGAMQRLAVVMPKEMPPEEAQEFQQLMAETHAGLGNSSKNLFLAGGADVKVVGSSLDQYGLKDFRGPLETRVAVRSRMPATILGISEGNQGSALNASTYAQTRRMLADGFFTPHADGYAASLETIAPPPRKTNNYPNGSYLTWDPERVMFLQEDEKDKADIFGVQAGSVRQLTDAGYNPDSILDAVHHADVRKLEHSGLMSVQLLPPGGNPDQQEAAE